MTKYITKLISGDQMYYLKDTEAREALVDKTEKGVANGIATLDSSGKVPSSQLPSYVDDVLEGYSHNGLFYATLTPGEEGEPDTYSDLITPETGKIYVDKATNNTFRWSGSAYIMIGSSGGGGYTAGSGIDITNAEISVDNTVLRNTDVDSTIPSTSSSNIPTSDAVKLYVDAGLDDKVDKISGKGLSTNDYTTDEKNKLAGIAAGAEANVQSDWNATSGDAFIKNKPALGSAAFTESSDYAASNHNHDARYASLVAATGPSIESGTDLDTLLTAGTYYTASSAVTNSLVNCPYTGSNMKLVVMYDGNSKYGRQIVFGYSGNAIYVRPINNLVPGSWQRILYTNSSLDASKLTGTVPAECYTDTKYTLPTASASVLGGVKVGTNLSISNGVLSATDTTYSNATEEAAGLMSAADKTTLDGLSILSPVVRANRNTGDTAQWTIFASIDYPSVTRYDDIVLLVQGLGYYHSGQNTGCWIVECRTKYNGGTNPNTIGMTVTELSPKGSAGTVKFGYYTDTTEGKTYFGVYTSTRHHYIETIKLGGQNIEHLKTRKVLTEAPAGWSSLPTEGVTTRKCLSEQDFSMSYSKDTSGNTTYHLTIGDSTYDIADTDTRYKDFWPSGTNAASGLVPKPSTAPGTTKYLREDATWAVPPDTKYTLPTASASTLGGIKVGTNLSISSGVLSATDSHYTTHMYAGGSKATANAAVTSPYITVVDNTTYRNQVRLIGSGGTTVSSDASGNITISSTDNDTDNYRYITYTTNVVENSSASLSLDGRIPVHFVTTTANITGLTLSNNPPDGHECHVLITASASKTVTIAYNSSSRVTPDKNSITLTIPAGGYVEVNFIRVNSKTYVRAI